jgi:hypothetical protein
MTRTQIQFPDPLYQRLKEIAERQDWSLSEVMRKAAEHFITRFPEDPKPKAVWRFPTLDSVLRSMPSLRAMLHDCRG